MKKILVTWELNQKWDGLIVWSWTWQCVHWPWTLKRSLTLGRLPVIKVHVWGKIHHICDGDDAALGHRGDWGKNIFWFLVLKLRDETLLWKWSYDNNSGSLSGFNPKWGGGLQLGSFASSLLVSCQKSSFWGQEVCVAFQIKARRQQLQLRDGVMDKLDSFISSIISSLPADLQIVLGTGASPWRQLTPQPGRTLVFISIFTLHRKTNIGSNLQFLEYLNFI